MVEIAENKKETLKSVPISLPYGDELGFTHLGNVLFGIRKIEEYSQAFDRPVILWSILHGPGTKWQNYFVTSEGRAISLVERRPRRFAHYNLDNLLEEKDKINRAQKGEKSPYRVDNEGRIVGYNI
ncbi:MAG: hypothetical protein AABW87_01065 [Nanoarchaeota archaeon]